jgi:putative transposase
VDEAIRAKAEEKGWEIVALEVMPDHVHLFVKHSPKCSVSHVANPLKGSQLPTLWSSSYFAASVGAVSAATVQRYIDTQWERPGQKEGGA